MVFVLYRKGWGETPWTRIEETAIRGRAFEEGYEFLTLALLDKPAEAPDWVPKNRIWIGLDRWEIEGAAAVIEARVQEKGGTPNEETLEDMALRFKREIAVEEQKQAFLQSGKGVQAANKAVAELFSELRRVVEDASDGESTIGLSIDVGERECAIYGERFCVHFYWNLTYSHTLDFSGLYLELWDGHVAINGSDKMGTIMDKPKEIKELKFKLSRYGQ